MFPLKKFIKTSSLVFGLFFLCCYMGCIHEEPLVPVETGNNPPDTSQQIGEEDTTNAPPAILTFSAHPLKVPMGGKVNLSVTTEDPDGDELTYEWQCMGGVSGTGKDVVWTAPEGAT